MAMEGLRAWAAEEMRRTMAGAVAVNGDEGGEEEGREGAEAGEKVGDATSFMRSATERQRERRRELQVLLSPEGRVGRELTEAKRRVQESSRCVEELEQGRRKMVEKLEDLKRRGECDGAFHALEELQLRVQGIEDLQKRTELLQRSMQVVAGADGKPNIASLSELLQQCSFSQALRQAIEAKLGSLVEGERKELSDELTVIMKEVGWPKPLVLSDDTEEEVMKVVEGGDQLLRAKPGKGGAGGMQRINVTILKLSVLQAACLQAGEQDKSLSSFQSWAVEKLLAPLSLRFNFHFRSTRATNRLDKPDWYFSYQLSRLREHLPFLLRVVQPLVRASLHDRFPDYNAAVQFAAALSEQCSEKIKADSNLLVEEGNLLMLTISEALQYDKNISNLLSSTDGIRSFHKCEVSCMARISRLESLMARWLQLESLSRAEQVRQWLSSDEELRVCHVSPQQPGEAEDAHALRMRYLHDWGSKSAQGIMAAVEDVGCRYETLPDQLRVKFARQVQENHILVPYLEGLRDKATTWIRRWEKLASWRREVAVQQSNQNLTGRLAKNAIDAVVYVASTEHASTAEGLEGCELSELCGICCSAQYCSLALEELVDEDMLGRMEEEEDAGKANEEIYEMFSQTSREFLAVSHDCVEQIVAVMAKDFEDAAARYLQQGRSAGSRGFSLDPTATEATEMSPDMCEPIEVLRSHLHAMQLSLPPQARVRVWSCVAERVDQVLFERISSLAVVSPPAAAQISLDVKLVTGLFAPFTSKPSNFLKRIKESCLLLAMPVKDMRRLVDTLDDPATRYREDALASCGIHLLSFQQARAICGKRADLL
eukprot:754376-Hanusia_phi.AAC.2